MPKVTTLTNFYRLPALAHDHRCSIVGRRDRQAGRHQQYGLYLVRLKMIDIKEMSLDSVSLMASLGT
jgi:hypothetical protein